MAPQRRASATPALARESSIFNQLTGRPIRRGAGQKQKEEGYVDSAVIEDDIIPVESCSEDEDGNPRVSRVVKRKRTPSPSPPPLDEVIDDDLLSVRDESSDEGSDAGRPIELTFNIPAGFTGPLVVQLDRKLLASADADSSTPLTPTGKHGNRFGLGSWRRKRHTKPKKPRAKRPVPKRSKSTHEPDSMGFLTLPPELRNKIYNFLFISQTELRFSNPAFGMSSAFLRTCKQVHEEGRSILYGENTFVFERNRNSRSPFWDPVAKEIGYKDMRRFLIMIGDNLTLLRNIRAVFEDATPSSAPYVKTQEERRYIHDEHLNECLRILRWTELKKLTLCFHGRKILWEYDGAPFLDRLRRIQADKVDIISNPRSWHMDLKIHYTVKEKLIPLMTRNPPLHSIE